jgi:hypothetical protein
MKKPTKKLALPVETIRALTSVELRAVAGGGASLGCSIIKPCATVA